MNMMDRKSAPESLNCYRHRHIPAITSCVRCRRKICASCVDSAVKYPHLCPTCYGVEYDSLQVQKKRDRKKAIKRGMVAAIVVVAILILVPIVNWSIDNAIEEKPEKVVETTPIANAYLLDDDVYLDLKDQVYTKSTNKVTLDVKIYLTNNFLSDTSNIRIDLLVLKNTTIRDEKFATLEKISSNQSVDCYFTGLVLDPGNYYVHLVLWKADKVYRQVRISFVLSQNDVSSFMRLGESELNSNDPYPSQPEPITVNRDQVIKEDIIDNFFAFLPVLILVLVIEAVIMGLVIFARENSFVPGNIYANIPYEDVAPPAPPRPQVEWAPADAENVADCPPRTEAPEIKASEQMRQEPQIPTPEQFKAEQDSAMVEAIQVPQEPDPQTAPNNGTKADEGVKV